MKIQIMIQVHIHVWQETMLTEQVNIISTVQLMKPVQNHWL
ncbi:unknown [Parabacteroides sp. CAG:409]|nr:unknown [Parabacteroides sp. CAG:409]